MSKPLFSPRPLQIKGMSLLVSESSARLFLKPGRGKTAVALKAFDILKKQGHVDCMLVISYLRVITTSWPHQIGYWQDFDHLTYQIIHGGQEARRKAMNTPADIYLMNAEGLIGTEFGPVCLNPNVKRKRYGPNSYALAWFKGRRVMLVCDESTLFKNASSLRSQSLKTYLPHTSRRVVMTGTPRPGRLENLFFQCYITDLGKDLGQFITHFRRNYMRPDDSGFGYTELPGAAERVSKAIAPTTLISDGRDDDMPIWEVPVWVPMAEHVKAQYNELKREFLLALGDSTVMAPNSGVLWGKLRQFAQGAIFDTQEGDDSWIEVHEGKLDALENILGELDGEPAFCLYAFRHDYVRINARLCHTVPRVGGGIGVAQGVANCKLFGAGQLPLLLGHPASVARGVDGLQQNCSNVIWFGNSPSWEETYQANLRIARSGNTKESVTVYRIMMDCGVERAILETCRSKEIMESEFLSLLRKELSEEQ